MKIITWLLANGATLVGVLQALVKALKEVLTGIVNILSLFMTAEVAENSVKTVRNFMNSIDGFLEKIKGYLLQ
jgi:hypothetical protein